MLMANLAADSSADASTHDDDVLVLNTHYNVYELDKILSVLCKDFLGRVFVLLVNAIA